MFHCREKELHDLNKRYTKDNFECIVVYGRRCVAILQELSPEEMEKAFQNHMAERKAKTA